MNKKIEIEITEEQEKYLKQYSQLFDKEALEHGTRLPVIKVQTRYWQVSHDGYEDDYLYCFDEDEFKTLEELKKYLLEYDYFEENEDKDFINSYLERIDEDTKLYGKFEDKELSIEIEFLPIKYYWRDRGYFLTIKEAKEYQQYQSHNLGISRIYTDYVGYSNYGDLPPLLNLLKEIGDKLNQGEEADDN